jgi:maleate isomerase
LTVRSTRCVGLIALAEDEVAEAAFRNHFVGDDVRIVTTRVRRIDFENARDVADIQPFELLREAVERLPKPQRLDMVAFSCTSITIALGLDETLRFFEQALPGVPATTPAHALRVALRERKARRIALLTPYPRFIHDQALKFWRDEGLTVAHEYTFDLVNDADINDVTPEAIESAAMAIARDVDALVISCTGLQSYMAIPRLRMRLRMPVLASSEAMAWDVMQRLGVAARTNND